MTDKEIKGIDRILNYIKHTSADYEKIKISYNFIKSDLPVFEESIKLCQQLDLISIDNKWNCTLTPNGYKIYRLGGYAHQIKMEKRKDFLICSGQWAIVISGLYYILEIIKSICKLSNN